MSIIVCSQDDVIADECVSCGGWLHRVQRGGFVGPHGWKFCEPDCIDDQLDREVVDHEAAHIGVRDLLCECDICTARGLPTQAMRDEYEAYRGSCGATEETPNG